MTMTVPKHRSVGTSVSLAFLLSLTFLTPPSHTVTSAASDDSNPSTSVWIVTNQDGTYNMTVVGQVESKSSSTGRNLKDGCDSFNGGGSFKDLKASYSGRDGFPTCTFSGKSIDISEVDGFIERKDGKYVLDIKKGNLPPSSSGLDSGYTLSVTFPGRVTDADGDGISGDTVTFTESRRYRVNGKDTPASPWAWVIMRAVVVGTIGDDLFWFLKRKKMAQQQVYTIGASGCVPQQQPCAPGQVQALGAIPPSPSSFVTQSDSQPGPDGTMPPGAVPLPPGYPSVPPPPS